MAVGPQREGEPRTVVVPESFFGAVGVRLFKYLGPNAAESILYEIGRDAGRAFVNIEERSQGHHMRTDGEVRALLSKFGTEYRWAEVELKSLDVPGKFAVIEWRRGLGVRRGSSRVPVCHVGRGLLSGAAEIIFGSTCDAIETKCEGMGDDHCEIVVGIPEKVSEVAEEHG